MKCKIFFQLSNFIIVSHQIPGSESALTPNFGSGSSLTPMLLITIASPECNVDLLLSKDAYFLCLLRSPTLEYFLSQLGHSNILE